MASAVPTPEVQTAAATWQAAASACGMLFPPPSDKPFDPCALDTAPIPKDDLTPTASFWDLYQKPILIGGVGLLAVLGLKMYMSRRGKVAP